jgi:hypothetical protein
MGVVGDKDLLDARHANAHFGVHLMLGHFQDLGVVTPRQKILVLIDIRHQSKHFLGRIPDQDRFKKFLHTIALILEIVISLCLGLQI